MKLVFATNNQHKLHEIKHLLDGSFELLSLNDINCTDDIPENQETIEGNASEKAFYIWNKYQLNCFADDTGLEIEALNGEPGVYSARYAGDEKSPEKNIELVLQKMAKIKNRKARFKTVISLVIDGKEVQFEGLVEGNILEEKKGQSGFGYDPIFQPIESQFSFAEMPLSEKNKISHRGRATRKLVEYLTHLVHK
jgi:XTP/dITP diphosphohydrolase